MTIEGRRRAFLLVAAVAGGVALSVERGETHKPITSKYTYNEDVFPILRDRCGRCHVPDGVAPMSLMTYQDAFPWGESVRAEIIAGHMPPWHAQAGALRFKNAAAITAAEIDKILVWVSGGIPQGNPQNIPPPVALGRHWPIGKPDLVIQLPEATVARETSEVVQEFSVPAATTTTTWVRAVDLLPGTPSIVRQATISVRAKTKANDAAVVPESVLAVWLPGDDPAGADGAAFRLPAGAELVVRMHYRKTYSYEGQEMTDRSAVGLYFARGAPAEIRRFTVASAPVTSTRARVSFSRTVTEDVQALAIRPDPSLTNARLQVEAVSANGVRAPVIQLAVRPDWTRRYWFDPPLRLARGTRIEVAALLNGADALLPPAATPLPPQAIDGKPISVMFDIVSARQVQKP